MTYTMTLQETQQFSFNLTTLLIVLYVVLMVFFFFLLRSRQKIKSRKRKYRHDANQLSNENQQLQMDKGHLKRELEEIKRQNEQLIAQIEKFKQITNVSTKPIVRQVQSKETVDVVYEEDDSPAPEIELQVPNIQESSSIRTEPVFYLGFPDSDNTFYALEATDTPSDESFYKIVGDDIMLYDNIDPDKMKMALNFIENHVKRACIILNSKEPFHTKIVMEDSGKVEQDGDDFKITTKLKVRYD